MKGTVNDMSLIFLTFIHVILVGLFRGNQMCDLISDFVVKLSAVSANPLGELVPLIEVPNNGCANAPESLTRLGAFCVLLGRRRHGVVLQRVVEGGEMKEICEDKVGVVWRDSKSSTRWVRWRKDGGLHLWRVKAERYSAEYEVAVRS
jgi:hypothetical protein